MNGCDPNSLSTKQDNIHNSSNSSSNQVDGSNIGTMFSSNFTSPFDTEQQASDMFNKFSRFPPYPNQYTTEQVEPVFTEERVEENDFSPLWGFSSKFSGLSLEDPKSDRALSAPFMTRFGSDYYNGEDSFQITTPEPQSPYSPYNDIWDSGNNNSHFHPRDNSTSLFSSPRFLNHESVNPSMGRLGDSPMSQLLSGGAPQISSISRNDYGAPGTFPSQNVQPSMNLRNPIATRPQVPAFPTFPTATSNVNQSSSAYISQGLQPQPMTHHRTSSADSFMNERHATIDPISPRGTPTINIFADSSLAQSSAPVCRYFANGFCSRGENCNFSHVEKDDKEKRIRNSTSTLQTTPPSTGTGTGKSRRVRAVSANHPVYANDQVSNQVYKMCKDQHGCRYLQKKLEEKEKHPMIVDTIFNEVYDHMVELMTDPFGNYLCQKLIEHCDQQQQLLIVQKVAPHLVTISKNMHGTRAVQKMIECLSTPAQVQLVVNSLKSSVVALIQDLNGNHVIQRCLNQLSTADKQFVYDAVASNCVEVATHRHGCCVMQRCIDFASNEQRLQLVREIAFHVLTLVKDPFGNYVVQYVLDLQFSIVKIDLIQKFCGHLVTLSTQKFSSNVIEKCLHVADPSVQFLLIDELMQSDTLPHLLQDPYGNYVIQTALTIAVPEQRNRLVEEIRPLLPALRNTPYGKRIQNKITKDCTSK